MWFTISLFLIKYVILQEHAWFNLKEQFTILMKAIKVIWTLQTYYA